jgi:serine/threonine protein kinase
MELTLENKRNKDEKIQLKYGLSNLSKLVKNLDIFIEEYKMLKILRENMKKCLCVILDNTHNKKYVLKAKLLDFVSENEIEIYKKLRENPNKNILTIKKMYKSKNFFIVIYDYIDGFDMTDLSYNSLYDDNITHIYNDCIDALSFLHNLGICHRDIKPDNIIIAKNKENNIYYPIIIDFDLSIIDSDKIKKNEDLLKLTQTFYYYYFSEFSFDSSFDEELIYNYDGPNKNFVNMIGWILEHNKNSCPSMREIKEIINKF